MESRTRNEMRWGKSTETSEEPHERDERTPDERTGSRAREWWGIDAIREIVSGGYNGERLKECQSQYA